MTKIQDASLYEILPFNIKNDNIEAQALSYAVQQAISMLCKFSDGVRVMAAIDDMPEMVIDNLAVELNLPCFYTESDLTIKRALVKEAIVWHTIAGTASAIRRYFSTISQDTDIQEWFEYGGKPYHFRIVATIPEEQEIKENLLKNIVEQIKQLKNARSILDEALIIKEHNCNTDLIFALGTAEIKEKSLGTYLNSSYWFDRENDTAFFSAADDSVFCDECGNIFAV